MVELAGVVDRALVHCNPFETGGKKRGEPGHAVAFVQSWGYIERPPQPGDLG